jgi:prevent-host-death family protein
MAAEQGIQIAEDGTAEVSMTYARANLTQLIREVRYGRRLGAFTERGERSAYVVPPDEYERKTKASRTLEALWQMHADLVSGEPKPDALHTARILYEALEAADRRAGDG